ncbi:hypothetical protein L1987_70900 [Smallanthus sonchifolius]|uniref:Uncharacterized protein n=1 Tax=Smallanthus sonchifolius TaxID=185202 RepID=A0ACB9AR98_9ASTR|nr:hypothetical protein L1987_70900 [Smallanthus sonchifolius]
MIYESKDIELKKVILDEMPGGPEAFELAAKFCYGIAVDPTADMVAALRCAAEYLEMTEDMEEGNLIFKTEAFLNYVVLSSWKDSILVLQSCENLSPWAENLQIVRRCSESVSWKACTDPTGVRWQHTKEGNDSGPMGPDWWCEDVSILRIDHFVRVITAIKVKGMRHELVGAAIMHYAMKLLPGMIKDGSLGSGEEGSGMASGASKCNCGLCIITMVNKPDHHSSPQGKRQREIIESLISIIPPQNDSVSCSFLLRLLRIANMVIVSPALVTELEKRVGMQLENATLADLLIPSYNRSETTYDVNVVQRLLEHFLVQEQMDILSPERSPIVENNEGIQRRNEPNAKTIVARLIDSYLVEVSRDKNLSLTNFQVLAEALPESARSCDDGIYRAIDSYLKVHPMLSKQERRRNTTIVSSGWATAKKDINTLKFDLEAVKTKYLDLQHDMEILQKQSDNIGKLKHQSSWSSGWKRLSRMTKITTIDNARIRPQGNTEVLKTSRRWRNSLS